MRDNVAWDGIRDFAPIIFATTEPNILVVHPLLPVKSVKELIALAKARPGALNYASIATGGPSHLAAELFKSMAGVNIVRIPYKGASPAAMDLVSGQVQLSFAAAASVAAPVKSGRLRALAITILQPSALFPGVPTVAASGLPGYEAGTVTGMFAPAKTPAAIINRLNREMAQALNRPEVKEKFSGAGQEIVGGSPDQFAAAIKADATRMGKVIKDAGIRDE